MFRFYETMFFLCIVACTGSFIFTPARPPTAEVSKTRPRQQALTSGRDHALQIETVLADVATELDNPAALRAQLGRQSSNTSGSVGDIENSRADIVRAQKLFDQASSHGEDDIERAIKADLSQAVAKGGAAHLGKPWRPIPKAELACQPDLAACPLGWDLRGVLCMAGEEYAGPCGTELDLTDRSIDEKLAMGQACKLQWPCQGECVQEFGEPCPAMWQQTGDTICEAPPDYRGDCERVLDTEGMSDKDKTSFGEACGALWPCQTPSLHNYNDVCPMGWELEDGEVCSAPKDYAGPCSSVAHMGGLTVSNKKQHEAACGTSWPAMPRECPRDYMASCPFGWLQKETGSNFVCVAPLQYEKCNRVQTFDGMRPDEKRDWASKCLAKFPCQGVARSFCERDFSYPCPAEWYVLNGGQSCHAPGDYQGPCASVMNGLLDMSEDQKEALQKTCGAHWPCIGESSTAAAVLQPKASSSVHRPATSAIYTKRSGPVQPNTGAIVG